MNTGQDSVSTLPPTASAQDNQNPQGVSPLSLQPVPAVGDQSQLPGSAQTLQVVGAPDGSTISAAPKSAAGDIITTFLIVVTVVLLAGGLRLLNMSNKQA
jgi:hypothetical protein